MGGCIKILFEFQSKNPMKMSPSLFYMQETQHQAREAAGYEL